MTDNKELEKKNQALKEQLNALQHSVVSEGDVGRAEVESLRAELQASQNSAQKLQQSLKVCWYGEG